MVLLSIAVLNHALKRQKGLEENGDNLGYASYSDKRNPTPPEFFEQDMDKCNPLRYALYHNKRELTPPEFYKHHHRDKKTLWITLGIILLLLEIVFLYFGISMALKVSRSTPELIIHLLLAFFITIPYVFCNTVFSTDAYKAFIRK